VRVLLVAETDASATPIGDAFFERLRVRLVEYAFSRGMRDRADDVAQDTLAILWEKYAGRDEHELTRLAYGICKMKIFEAMRAYARVGSLPDGIPDPPDQTPTAYERIHRDEQRRLLHDAIARLGVRCRQLFRLRLEGKTTAQIAGIMGAPGSTIYVWESRCRHDLFGRLAWERR
jgi:RNA polymerase sigma-70 factor (ECF subfamily)